MCQGISAIAVQRGDRRLYFKSGVNSHSEIREEFGLKDTQPQEQVNLEAHLYGDFFNIKDWKIVIDHQVGDIPDWFKDNQPAIEGLFWDYITDEIKDTKASNTYKGTLDLGYLKDGSGIILPKTIGGDLNLSSLTTAQGLVFPKTIGGDLSLDSLTTAKGLVLPKTIGGDLDLSSLTTAKGLVLPKTIGGDLWLSSLTTAKGLVLPKTLGGDLWLSSLTTAKGLVLPKTLGGDLSLDSLTTAKGLVLPKGFDMDRYCGPKIK
jgi:phage protein U